MSSISRDSENAVDDVQSLGSLQIKQETRIVVPERPKSSAVTVSILSPEILSEVFLELAGSLTTRSMSASLRERAYRWIVVTEVCRFWREVALGCPALWTYIGRIMT